MAKKTGTVKSVEALKHDEAKRRTIPTAEFSSVMEKEKQTPVPVAFPCNVAGLIDEKLTRNRHLDPQLV